MQTRHPIVVLLILSFVTLFGCENASLSNSDLNPDIFKAKELVYLNRFDEAQEILIKTDSTGLDEYNKAAYLLASGFLNYRLGQRDLSLKYLKRATELISDENDAELSAELNLINGFIFEELILRSEASNAYFNAYEFFKNESSPNKLFYALLGIARTSPGGEAYLKQAEELLKQLKSNHFQVIYLNAEAALTSDVRDRNNIILKSLNFFDEHYALKKQISIYTGIALNYQLLDQVDSALYYLNVAQKTIADNKLPPEQNFHFYIIKAYIESSNQQETQALETLDILFNNASNEPGILSSAYLRRSLIMQNQGKYAEAYYDIKKYTKLADEEQALSERYQLGLLSVRYQVQQKELLLNQARWNLVKTVIFSGICIIILWAMFWFSKKQISKKKKALEVKYEKTNKMLIEQVEESIKEAQIGQQTNASERKSTLDTVLKLQEFGALFRANHPLFREKLSNTHPELTVNDFKHCDCILGGMTVFQTTKILGVKEGAVKKARQKLRWHFDCASHKDLLQYLHTIDES